jgi:prephenate dehydrogenase
MHFQSIGIVGVGLIGGSLGLALKRCCPSIHILGVGRDPKRLETALEMRAIDRWQTEDKADFRDCDLIVLATPVEHILLRLGTLGAHLRPGVVVTDVGSTKRHICAEAWNRLPPGVEFIGGHPIAGREVAGVENCLAGLFEGAPYVLCPKPGASAGSLPHLGCLVEELGASVWVMSPEEHDRSIARLSHIPQLLSVALASLNSTERLGIAGSGFRSMTRLAGSPYSVWESILETNSDNIDQGLGELIAHLGTVREALRNRSLSGEFARAQDVYRMTLRKDGST